MLTRNENQSRNTVYYKIIIKKTWNCQVFFNCARPVGPFYNISEVQKPQFFSKKTKSDFDSKGDETLKVRKLELFIFYRIASL